MRRHLVHVLVGGAVLLGALVVLGVPLSAAAPYALVLACPLMMVVMMLAMGRNGHGRDPHPGCCEHPGHDRRAQAPDEVGPAPEPGPGPRPRWSEPPR